MPCLQVCPAVRPFATVLLQHINPFQKELSKQEGHRAHGVTQRLTAMVPITGYLQKVLAENRWALDLFFYQAWCQILKA